MSTPPRSWTPTVADVRASIGRSIPDVIAPGLEVLFCGINPGLYSAAAAHHFARPGNRFWPALHLAAFTPRLMAPHESDEFVASGYGITSLVRRATATARELAAPELVAGRRRLARKVRIYRPRWIAILGVGAYRTAFADAGAAVGPQRVGLGGSSVWLLPSPSGANGSYPLIDLVREMRLFYDEVRSAKASLTRQAQQE